MNYIKIIFFFLLFISSEVYSQKLKSFVYNEFKYSDTSFFGRKLKSQIIKKEISDGMLFLDIASDENCSGKFETKWYFSSDTLFIFCHLSKQGSKEIKACNRPFIFHYKFLNIKLKEFKTYYNGYEIYEQSEKFETYPVEFEFSNGDTINLIDKYGQRQGKWIFRDTTGQVSYMANCINNFCEEYYYKDGKVRKKIINKLNYSQKTEYDEMGNPIEEHCWTDNNEIAKYWNKLGHLSFEKRYLKDYILEIEYFENGKKKKECYKYYNGKIKCEEYSKN